MLNIDKSKENQNLRNSIPKLNFNKLDSNENKFNDKNKKKKNLSSLNLDNHKISKGSIFDNKEDHSKNNDINSSNSENSHQKLNYESDDLDDVIEFKFPDFYWLDIYDFKSKKQEAPIPSSHFISKNQENDQDFNIAELTDIIQKYNKTALSSLDDFIIEKQLYQHRDEIFQGIIKNEENENCFIKSFRIESQMELEEAKKEMNIYFHLLNIKTDENSDINEYINDFLGYYYDKQNSYFYVFYKYYKDSLHDQILIYDLKQKKQEKFSILYHLLKLLVIIHSNGIIHRDLRLEYFTFDSSSNHPKIFDFANAYQIDNFLKIKNEYLEQKDIEEIKYDISFNKMFFTPKYVPPELFSESPEFGYGEDIWSFGCLLIELFLDYSKYEEESFNSLLTRIFQGDQYKNKNHEPNGDIIILNAIPKIPKTIEKKVAQIIVKCIEPELSERLFTFGLVERFNLFFKEEGLKQLRISKEEKIQLEKMYNINERIYKSSRVDLANYESKAKVDSLSFESDKKSVFNLMEEKAIWLNCEIHQSKIRNIYCEECREMCCQSCYNSRHKGHLYKYVGGKQDEKSNVPTLIDKESIDYFEEKSKLKEMQLAIEKIEVDKNFKIVEEFSKNFNKDYLTEKERIAESYKSIREKVKDLHIMQLKNLESSKQNFLDTKFRKIFNESQKIENLCRIFYSSKNALLSHYNRFNASFIINEVNGNNFLLFRKKFERFAECANSLRESAEDLKKKSESLRIPGKYIFRRELYTDDLIKMFKTIESKIYSEKHKFFDYSTPDSLFLTEELLMVIPLTNTVFSYSKNSYKKFNVDFEKNKLKIHSFLPGCATLHQGEYFYITGGEIKDEATSSFTFMKINQKVIEESVEMNFTRRFHTMMSLENVQKDRKYICVIGGWDSKEVEMIETTKGISNKWLILPSMHYSRSDPTTFEFNKKYIYVFGGWDYSYKKSISEIERYEVFTGSSIKLTRKWEIVKIKGDSSLLQKYNMGLISVNGNNRGGDAQSDSILLVGGYDESFDYSTDVVKVEFYINQNYVNVVKEKEGLPLGGESSFWYEKNFHEVKNDSGEEIAVNFNCFNNIYVYNFKSKKFKQYPNPNTKL